MTNIWEMGFFWMSIAFSIACMLIMIVKSNFSGFELLLIMLLFPSLLVILSLIIKTPPGALNSGEFVELTKYTLKIIHDTLIDLTTSH